MRILSIDAAVTTQKEQTMLTIVVPGEPTAKGRPRIGINPGTGRAQAFTPSKTRQAEGEIKYFAMRAMHGRDIISGPVSLVVIAYRSKGMPGNADAKPGTKSRAQWDAANEGRIAPVSKPDGDNYLKAAQDACNGIVWKDDAQVVDCTIRKRFSDRPRLEIHVAIWDPTSE